MHKEQLCTSRGQGGDLATLCCPMLSALRKGGFGYYKTFLML